MPFSYELSVKALELDHPVNGQLTLRWSRGDKRVESDARPANGGWEFPTVLSMKSTMYRTKAGEYQEKSTTLDLVEKEAPGKERILASCSIELAHWGALEPGASHSMPSLFGAQPAPHLEATLAVTDLSRYDPDCLVSLRSSRPSIDDGGPLSSQGSSPAGSPRVSVYSSRDKDDFPVLLDEAIGKGLLAPTVEAEAAQPEEKPHDTPGESPVSIRQEASGRVETRPARVTIPATQVEGDSGEAGGAEEVGEESPKPVSMEGTVAEEDPEATTPTQTR